MSHHRATATRDQHGQPLQQHRSSTLLSPTRRCSRLLLSLLVLLLTWTSLLGVASARSVVVRAHGDRQQRSAVPVEDLTPTWKGASLLVDTRPPPAVPLFMPPLPRGHDAVGTPSTPPSKRDLDTDPDAEDSDFEVPRPFDSALSNNFTNGCSQYFKRLLKSDEFNDCHPFSLMLQTSSGFFDATKSYIGITQTLEATCGVDSGKCLNTMNSFAQELVAEDACKTDYENDNPQVLQAYNGLLAYEPLYQASCLRDDQGSYCFANAATNSSATTDSYPYYLPLGMELPGGARPTCNDCLQDAMAIFSSFAPNTTQPISQTYNAAAQQIAIYCGNDFVNVTAAPLKGAASTTSTTVTPTITLFIMFILFFFQ